jgi:hypothetical protein
VVIAVTIVLMMQVPVNQVIYVVAVRDCLMSTAWAVDMVYSVSCARMATRATSGVQRTDFEHVLFNNTFGSLVM